MMESRLFERSLSECTVYPERCSRLPVSQSEIIQLPRKYEKVRQIYKGSFTNVFLVRKRGLEEGVMYSAKYMMDNCRDGNVEVEILRQLQDSERVPAIVDVCHSAFQTILITEYLPGGNLLERLSCSSFRLTEKKCRVLLRQVVESVQFIHNQRVLHLNITPFNIVFSNKNTERGLKIIDFGHAVQLPANYNSHKLSKLQGTLEYLAPEVLHCDYVDTGTDLWSVGVIFYMLVSGGVSPFFSGSRLRTMSRILRCDYSLSLDQLKHTSREVKQLISLLLVQDREDRLTSDQVLGHDWFQGGQETTKELETSWMRRCLARRRWYRALNTLRAMHVIRKLSSAEYKATERKVSSVNTRMVIEEGLAEPSEFAEFQLKFETVRQIGSGTFGSVYLIRDRGSGELAAAKYLRQRKEEVQQEAGLLQSLLSSALVVQLVGLFESPLNSVLVTEYLGGGDLITRTAPDTFCLTEKKCQIFVRQIVRGLQFIHSQRIIHLDLKPFNIMFANPEDDYNLRIIDFGLAERLAVDQDLLKMSMRGTLEFMSPEVMDCKFASTASDMWGVGAISYLLLSGGESPFWAGSRYRTMARTLTAQYSLELNVNFSLVSEEAKDFIRGLLVLETEGRMSATSCLQHPWLMNRTRGLSEREHWSTLETAWMRGILARRRWVRWFHAINAAQRMRKLSSQTFTSFSPSDS